MKFGEKLRCSRKRCNLTQSELADRAGLSLKTVINYENGKTYPHNRDTYNTLAEIVGTDPTYLYNEDDNSTDSNIHSDPHVQTDMLVQQISGLFAGGELSNEAKDNLMRTLQQIYWDNKDSARGKG